MSFRHLALAFGLLLAACETPPTDDTAATGTPGAPGYDGGVSSAGVSPGTQSDLEQNVGDRVFFAYDSSVLNATAQETLRRQAEWLQQYPQLSVVVEGHCDERGTRAYNLALGERRASSARNYLVSLGVNPRRITTVSYGKERPAVLGSNERAWAQNRRAVTVISY